MKYVISSLLSLSLVCSPTWLAADDCLTAAQEEANDLYNAGNACEDGIFNAISASMIGWGLGLAAAIALITGLVHQSHSHAHDDSD